jgi:hypothetical protein
MLPKDLNILIIDPLASDSYSHLYEDDLFWSNNLSFYCSKFGICSSRESIDFVKKRVDSDIFIDYQILSRDKRFSYRLNILFNLLKLRKTAYSDIIFQSFEEISTLFFIILSFRIRTHLIFTNNLSNSKFSRHSKYHIILLKLCCLMSKTIFVHSVFEKEILVKKFKIQSKKIFIKPYHQISKKWYIPLNKYKNGYILFIGNPKSSRPLKPFLELVLKDINKEFSYVIAGVSTEDLINYPNFSELENVEIIYGKLSYPDYSKIISNSSFIILTHNKLFEGLLSGIFCDAIASYTPIVCSHMEPFIEFSNKYGKLGIYLDFECDNLFENFKYQAKKFNYDDYIKTIDVLKMSTSPKIISKLLINAITRE